MFDHLAARLQTVQELIKVSDQQRTKTMTYLREIATRWDPPSGIEPCSADCHHCVNMRQPLTTPKGSAAQAAATSTAGGSLVAVRSAGLHLLGFVSCCAGSGCCAELAC